MAANNEVKIKISAQDQAGGVFGRLAKDADSFRLRINGIERAIQEYSATASAVAAVGFFVSAIKQAEAYQGSLRGLGSIARYAGEDIGAAMQKASELSADGLLTVQDAATALKNLLSRGFSLDEATRMINAFKDSAAFGRQASLSLSEAVKTATEGIKNENSILVDNAGVTKNVSVMWKEYAAAQGISVDKLTIAQKRQAELNGVLREAEGVAGNAALASAGLTGKVAALGKAAQDFKVQLGQALMPAAEMFVDVGRKFVAGFATPFIGGIEIMSVRLAGFLDKINRLGGKSLFDMAFGPSTDMSDIDRNVDEGIAAILKKYESGVMPELGKDSGKRRADAEKEAEAGLKSAEAHKVAAKAAKDHGKELDALISRYLPLKKEAEDVAQAQKGFDELLAAGRISADEYAVATENLRQSTVAYKEALQFDQDIADVDSALSDFFADVEQMQAKSINDWYRYSEAMDGAFADLTLSVLPEHEQAVENVKRRYAELEAMLPDLYAAGKISWEQATAFQDQLSYRLRDDLAEIEAGNAQTATAVSDSWKHAMESIQDSIADMLYEFDFSMDSMVELARRGAANAAAAMIMDPFTRPGTVGAGGSGGLSLGNLFSGSGWDGLQNSIAFGLDRIGFGDAAWDVMGMDSSMLGSGLAGIGTTVMGLLNGQSFGQSGMSGLGAFLGGLTPLGPIGSMLGGLAGNWLGDALGFGDNLQRGYLGTGYRYDYTPGAGFSQVESAEWRESRNGEDFRAGSAAIADSLLTTLNTISGSFGSLFGSLGRGSQYSDYLDQFGASAGGSRSYVNDPRVIDSMYGPGGLPSRAGSTLDLNAYISGEDEGEIARSVENIWRAATAGIIAPLVEGSADMLSEAMEGSFEALDLSMFSATAADKLRGGLTDAIDLMRIGEITDDADLARELSELESGLGQARYVIDYVTEVTGLLGQIDAAMELDSLTAAGRELAGINSKYDEMADTLGRLGVTVEATNLELARAAEIDRMRGGYEADWQGRLDSATLSDAALRMQEIAKFYDEQYRIAADIGADTTTLDRARAAEIGLFFDSITTNINRYTDTIDWQSESLIDTYRSQYDAVLMLNQAYDGSIDATVALDTALNTLYATEVAAMQAIDAAVSSINQSFGGSIESIRTAMMSDAEKYQYYRETAERMLTGISTMTDPERIRSAMEDINRYTMSAWGTMDQAQQARWGGDFLSFLDQVSALGRGRLSELGAEVTGNHDDLGQTLAGAFTSAIPSLEASAHTMASATGDFAAAVAAFAAAAANMRVSIDLTTSEVGH